ncbi:MAG: hypothetical protein JXA61_07305 [Bacteroidales bacterium]|nr:hypothetical protein [Bacteroidales bacterium]
MFSGSFIFAFPDLFKAGCPYGINIPGEESPREITEPVMMIHCHEYPRHRVRVDGTVTVTNSRKGLFTIDSGDRTSEGTMTLSRFGGRYNLRFRYRNHRQ